MFFETDNTILPALPTSTRTALLSDKRRKPNPSDLVINEEHWASRDVLFYSLCDWYPKDIVSGQRASWDDSQEDFAWIQKPAYGNDYYINSIGSTSAALNFKGLRLDMSGGVTLGAYCRASVIGNFKTLFSLSDGGYVNNYLIFYGCITGGAIRLYTSAEKPISVAGIVIQDEWAWFHIVAKPGENVKFFKNGVEVANDGSPLVLTTPLDTAWSQLNIGGNYAWSDETYDGDISRVCVFNKAYSSEQLTDLIKEPNTLFRHASIKIRGMQYKALGYHIPESRLEDPSFMRSKTVNAEAVIDVENWAGKDVSYYCTMAWPFKDIVSGKSAVLKGTVGTTLFAPAWKNETVLESTGAQASSDCYAHENLQLNFDSYTDTGKGLTIGIYCKPTGSNDWYTGVYLKGASGFILFYVPGHLPAAELNVYNSWSDQESVAGAVITDEWHWYFFSCRSDGDDARYFRDNTEIAPDSSYDLPMDDVGNVNEVWLGYNDEYSGEMFQGEIGKVILINNFWGLSEVSAFIKNPNQILVPK